MEKVFKKDYNGKFGDIEFNIEECQYCGHKIDFGYRLKDEKENLFIVCSRCCFVLLRLSKKDEKEFLKQDKIKKQIYKYKEIIEYFKNKYNMVPHWQNDYNHFSKKCKDFIKMEKHDEYIRFIFKGYVVTKDRDNDYLQSTKKGLKVETVNEIVKEIMTMNINNR